MEEQLFSKSAPQPPPAAGKPSRPQDKKDKESKSNLAMPLDHNNMLKTVQKNDTVKIKRMLKTTRIPPMRMYPGEVQEKVKKEVFSYEEFESDEINPYAKDLTAEDLMRDPEYLKIDQSKLPLEIFDNIELQALDKTPEEWVASGSMAKTPYYHSGEWIWRPVEVSQP
jgi:hypothetical protein